MRASSNETERNELERQAAQRGGTDGAANYCYYFLFFSLHSPRELQLGESHKLAEHDNANLLLNSLTLL